MTKKFKFATKPLDYNQKFYYLSFIEDSFYSKDYWRGWSFHSGLLKLHRIFLTKKGVKRARKFIKEFIESNPQKLKYITDMPEQGTKVWYGYGMWGKESDLISINFDINDELHKKLFSDHRLYKTAEDVIKAANEITLILKTEQKKQKYKYLTEVEQGAKVWFLDFNTLCIQFDYFDSDNPLHSALLACGVLFSKKKHALRAGNAMLRKINPLACGLSMPD